MLDVALKGGLVQRRRVRREKGLVTMATVGRLTEVTTRHAVGGVAMRANNVQFFGHAMAS